MKPDDDSKAFFLCKTFCFAVLFFPVSFIMKVNDFLMTDGALFFIALGVGFVAQIVDGGVGMGYGVISNTFLVSFGLPPSTASASVHTAEIVTTGISGFFHRKLGNVDKKIFWPLVISGVIGGVIGAYILSSIPGENVKPFVSIYLLIIGIAILHRAFQSFRQEHVKHGFFPLHTVVFIVTRILRFVRPKGGPANTSKFLAGLGFLGGFLDSIGGGGWGPMVTSTLVMKGEEPRMGIGSANAAEFFVTLATSITFMLHIGIQYWVFILGLLLGGGIAAPFAAYVCKRMSPKTLMILVGGVIVILSLYNFSTSFDMSYFEMLLKNFVRA